MPPSPQTPVTYRSRWMWSGDRWIADGRVTCVGRKIVSAGTEKVTGEIDLGNQLLLPGWVNAHTHLEFSSLAAPIPYEATFSSWIRNVVRWRRGETDETRRAAIGRGIAESGRSGVSLIGEISTGGWGPPTAMEQAAASTASVGISSPRLVVFDEILGLKNDAIAPQMADACQHLTTGGVRPVAVPLEEWSPHWSPGLSPHAPYSLSRDLFTETLALATRAHLPVAMHLAETLEELEFLATGTGPLAELFAEWGLWRVGDRAAFQSPLEVLQPLANLEQVLVIHGNYLTDSEMEFIAGRTGFSVVFCPRTHAYFRHERYPLAKLLNRGIRVALGTDSRASNPDLSLLAEVRDVARRYPEIAPATVLKMGTSWGAEALGLGHEYGTIGPGKQAAFAVVPISARVSDPFEALLDQ